MICDRIVIMVKGKIVREGTIEELTPNTALVRFELDRLPKDRAALLEGLRTDPTFGESGFELFADDETLNRLIDRLRLQGVGIRSIARKRMTLEDTFIDLVREMEA